MDYEVRSLFANFQNRTEVFSYILFEILSHNSENLMQKISGELEVQGLTVERMISLFDDLVICISDNGGSNK